MPTVFVVRRKIDGEYRDWGTIPPAKDQYVATAATREAAEEHARRLHRETVAEVSFADLNPFRGAKYEALTSFPPHVFRDWLSDADIDPPLPAPATKRPRATDPEAAAWATWWDAVANSLTGPQRAKVWEGLNLFCLFEVAEVEAEQKLAANGRKVYAVVCQNWQYDDNVYFGANEAMTVYRTRQRADAELKKLTDAFREMDEDDWEDAAGEYVVVELTIPAEA